MLIKKKKIERGSSAFGLWKCKKQLILPYDVEIFYGQVEGGFL